MFRGDQRHGYRNLDARLPAVAISVVCFAPATEARSHSAGANKARGELARVEVREVVD